MVRKTVLTLLLLPMSLFPLEVYSPLYHLMITSSYIASSQLSCGAWTSCSLPLSSGLLRLGGILYPLDPTLLKNVVLYMDSLTIGHTNFTDFLSNSTYDYFNPLLNVLTALAYGYGSQDSYTVKLAEIWIQRSFSDSGIHVLTPSFMNTYYGSSEYDYLATLLALAIAFKSQQVDGYLNGTALNSTLNSTFWQGLLSEILNPPPTSGLWHYTTARGLMAALSLLLNPSTASDICTSYAEPAYLQALEMSRKGEFVSIVLPFAAMMNASVIVICHTRYGYFNNTTEYNQALSWLELSYVNQVGRLDYIDGGTLPELEKLAIGLNPYILEIGDPRSNATELALQDRERYESLLQGTNTTSTITITLNDSISYTLTLTKTASTTLYSTSNSTRFTVTALPTPAILALLGSVVRRRRGQSSSRPHPPSNTV